VLCFTAQYIRSDRVRHLLAKRCPPSKRAGSALAARGIEVQTPVRTPDTYEEGLVPCGCCCCCCCRMGYGYTGPAGTSAACITGVVAIAQACHFCSLPTRSVCCSCQVQSCHACPVCLTDWSTEQAVFLLRTQIWMCHSLSCYEQMLSRMRAAFSQRPYAFGAAGC